MPSQGVQIRGVVGQVKWAYYTAAALHGYTVRRDKLTGQWSMSGTVVTKDAFKLNQRPLVFVAPHEKGAWRWDVLSHEIVDGVFRARLSPPDPSKEVGTWVDGYAVRK
jgi:hypothetical protein